MLTKTRRTETPAIRRSQILEAARDVLSRQGYSEVLVDEVAERAGIAKGTIYLYFRDKKALYDEVMAQVLSGLTDAARAAAASTGEPLGRLRAVLAAALEYMDENKDFFIACGQIRPDFQNARTVPPSRNQFRAFMRFVGEQIQACVRNQDLRPHDSMQGSLFFIALCRMTMMKKLFFHEKEPMVKATETVMDLFVNGLGTKR